MEIIQLHIINSVININSIKCNKMYWMKFSTKRYTTIPKTNEEFRILVLKYFRNYTPPSYGYVCYVFSGMRTLTRAAQPKRER